MTKIVSLAKSFWFSLFQTNEAPSRAGITRAIERNARSDEARIVTQSATVADSISHETSFLSNAEPYSVVRGRFYAALIVLPLLALLTIASYQLTLFALDIIPNEVIRKGSAVALVGATLLAIHFLLESLKRSSWVMFVVTAISVFVLGNAHYMLAQARAAVITDWIINGDRTVLESALGPAAADVGTSSLTSTLIPLLEAILPSMAVGLEFIAAVAMSFTLQAILDPALLGYWRVARLRRRAARLSAKAVVATSLAERADEEAQLTIDLGRNAKSLMSREAIVAIVVALIALLVITTDLFAAPVEGSNGCKAENQRIALLVDLSKSRTAADVTADAAAVSRILAEAQACSRYVVLGVGEDGWAAPRVLIDSTVTTSGGWMQQDLKNARKKLLAMWTQTSARLTPTYSGSDVLGTILYAIELLGLSPGRPGTLVSFTDGRQTRGIDLENNPPLAADQAARRAKDLGLVANIAGSKMFFFGASTTGKSPAHWNTLRDFWKTWTAMTGAAFGTYSIGRDVCPVTSLCTAGAAMASATPGAPAAVAPTVGRRDAAVSATATDRKPDAVCQSFSGSIGSSAQWSSGWIELDAPTDFRRGEPLRLTVGGSARKVVVRLLGRFDDPNSPNGVDGGVLDVPPNGTILLTVQRDHPATRQISVHGGVNPWGLYRLGGGNGPATLLSVERTCAQ
jgi:hypothetical protein